MKTEPLFFSSNVPLKVNFVEIDDIYTELHKELKIIYVVSGEISVDANDSRIILSENDFIIINSYDFVNLYSNTSDKSVILEFLIENINLNRFYKDFSNIRFKCCSTDSNTSNIRYDALRKYFSKVLNAIVENQDEKDMMILRNVVELSLFLINNFKYEEVSIKKKFLNKKRFINILGFLEENYDNENLTVEDIAEYVDLSSHYVLKIFRENFDTGLMDYLNSLRIKKSINDLLYTNKTIMEIAIDHGFTNTKSYHRIFKKIYNTSPGMYKKQNQENQKNENKVAIKKIDTETKSLLEVLNKFLYIENNDELLLETETNIIDLDFNNLKSKKIDHYWEKNISMGRASEGLKGDIQYQIKELKNDIAPSYIRFIGIFNDEMEIYNEDSSGIITYNYTYIDKLLDFLIQQNLKPFINIGFMPKKLGSKEYYIPLTNINSSYPKSIKLWKDLVGNFIKHLLERYGEEEVSLWYFEIWNNPDLKEFYWHESDEKFFNFFDETFKSIKNKSKKIKVGGPVVNVFSNEKWIENFLDYIKNKNIKLDFFSFHNYSIKIVNGKNRELRAENTDINLNSFEELNKRICLKLRKEFGNKIEVIISEWNMSPFSHFVHDTCYTSTFIIKKILSNLNTINTLTYWTCTENRVGTDIFYGGLGLFTTNNLKKASYNAFLLLNKLGDEYISKGSNHFITSTKNAIQIMLYNCDMRDINDKNKFYIDSKPKEFQLNLKNLNKSDYVITKYYLNKKSGSIYDAWLDMGAPEKITREINKFLKSREEMNMKIEKKTVENTIIINEVLDSDSVVFIEIKTVKVF